MGRLIGFLANRRDGLEQALEQERSVLGKETPAIGAVGWGIGFYQGDEVLHKKRPLAENEVADWNTITQGVQSDCVIIHLRQPTVGDFRTENAHPFRMRAWSFAHCGTINRFESLRKKILLNIPDFMQRNIRGTTDSEHFFHLILAFLQQAGQLEGARVEAPAVIAAISQAVQVVDSLCAEQSAQKPTLSFLLTDGYTMYALSRGEPIIFVQRRGSQLPATTTATANTTMLRYALITSTREVVPAGYQNVEYDSLLIIDRNLASRIIPLSTGTR